ncbi:MAG: FGGY-family carbohydrate kinase, partial [Actinomycetota bacterium]|nr:FGGY-family carbohydrate kinase [Actinomycetota bacterium]
EGMLMGLAQAVDALERAGVQPKRILLIGGAAANPAVRGIAATIFNVPVHVPPAGEYVADGAARQAAWVLSGAANPPEWRSADAQQIALDDVEVNAAVREQYELAQEAMYRLP